MLNKVNDNMEDDNAEYVKDVPDEPQVNHLEVRSLWYVFIECWVERGKDKKASNSSHEASVQVMLTNEEGHVGSEPEDESLEESRGDMFLPVS